MNWKAVEMPEQIAALPRDARGFPVPAFVYRPATWSAGEPLDLRVLDVPGSLKLMIERRCGICGQPVGYRMWFIGGPMCLYNRIFETPSHRECAEYAIQVCPHLNSSTHEYSTRAVADGNTHGDPNLIKARPRYLVIVSTRGYTIKTRDERGMPLAKPLAKIDLWTACEWRQNDGTPTADSCAVLDVPTDSGFVPAFYCFACIAQGRQAISTNPDHIASRWCAWCRTYHDAPALASVAV